MFCHLELNMKKLLSTLAFSALTLTALNSHAAPIPGFSDVADLGGGVYKFTFDTLPGPDIKNQDGLTFSGFGLLLTATSTGNTAGKVIQDVPSHGGLGVDGDPAGDNMTGDERLRFTLNQSFDLVDFSFNGKMNNDGHSDSADGEFGISTSGFSGGGNADLWDGIGTDSIPDFAAALADANTNFQGINWFSLYSLAGSNSPFKGYVESVTVRIANVPEPSALLLMSLGLAGFGLSRRKKQ